VISASVYTERLYGVHGAFIGEWELLG